MSPAPSTSRCRSGGARTFCSSSPLVNEQLWVGHFDLWNTENAVMFRHALLLAGGAEPTQRAMRDDARVAVEACERYFQAFQFVLWAGKSAREALDSVLFETEGEA